MTDDGGRTERSVARFHFVRCWSSVPGAEAAVEAAGGHRRRRAAEQPRGVSRIFLRLGVLFRRGRFGRSRIRSFGLRRWRLGLRPGCAGGALPTLRRGGGGFRFRRGSVGGLSRARSRALVLGLGAEQIGEEGADSAPTFRQPPGAPPPPPPPPNR